MKRLWYCISLVGIMGVLNAHPQTADITLQELEHDKPIELTGSWWPWGASKKDDGKTATTKGGHELSIPKEGDVYKWLQMYADIVGLLEDRSYRRIDFAKYVQTSLKAALAGVDAHSAFFAPDSYKSVLESTSGEFSGIGVSINGKSMEDEALTVVDVIESGPAAKAGLHPGDRIVQVEGASLRGLSTDEVVSKLKGKTGTKVSIKVLRNKKDPYSFTITRDVIKDQTSLCFCFKDQGIYYLSLKTFNEVAAQQMEALLEKANEGMCKGLIFDLRRNPGGTMDSAIDMAGLFLDKGSLVVLTKNNKGERVREYRTNRDPVLKSDAPIFILIDNFTASASEILAGALKHHSDDGKQKHPLHVFLVGTTTFGKGSVQELIPIKNECAVKVTSMLYYLPDDSSIQAKGINPDFMIKPKTIPEEELKWVNELYGKESSLKNHIKAEEVADKKEDKKNAQQEDKKGLWSRLFGNEQPSQGEHNEGEKKDDDDKSPEEKKKSLEEKQREAIALDVQIQASVNMINLLNIARKGNSDLRIRGNALTFLQQNYLTDTISSVEKVK